MNRLRLITSGVIGRLLPVLLLGLAMAWSACTRQPNRAEAYSPDIHYPTIELEEIAVLPAAPFAVAKSGNEYLMLNSTRDYANCRCILKDIN